MSEVFGELQSEKLAQESQVARDIIRELGYFGINDRQRWLIIHGLAMELENVEEMRALTSYIREVKGSSLFISRIYGSEGEDENG